MSNFWKFLNSPLVVVVIAFSIWPILTVLSSGVAVKLGIQQISEAVSEEVVKPFKNFGANQDKKTIAEAKILDNIVLSNVSFAHTTWKGNVKIIGTLTNNSNKIIKSIHLLSSLYQDGKLANVEEKWLSNVKILKPNSSVNFTFTTSISEGQNKDNLVPKIQVANMSIVE